MTGMNNALLQLALMLRGNTGLGSGIGNNWSGPLNANPWQQNSPSVTPMMNSWAAMSGPHQGMPGGHLPVTPAQEFFLFDPAYETPLGPMIEPKPWLIPPEPSPLPLPPDILPFVTPDNPTFEPPKGWVPRFDQDEMDEENWPVPRKDDPCKEEVEQAIAFCRKEIRRVKRGQSSGNFGNTFVQCMRGQLSAGCGGNLVAQADGPTTFS